MGFSWILRQIGETCSNSSNTCDAGLICGSCPANGNTRPRCTLVQPTSPTTKVPHIVFPDICLDFLCWFLDQVKGLPFNKYSWLTTHNSYARTGSTSGTGSVLLAPTNQEDSVTNQLQVCNGILISLLAEYFKILELLQNGVRGLMLDMYDFNNDIWLCHSFGGNCYNVTAFVSSSVYTSQFELE